MMTARVVGALLAIALAVVSLEHARAQSYRDYPPYPDHPSRARSSPAYPSDPYRAPPPPPIYTDEEDLPEDPYFDPPASNWRYEAARPAPGTEGPAPSIERPAPNIERHDLRPPAEIGNASGTALASLPQEIRPETGEPAELPPKYRRQLVEYHTKEPAGTIVVDTANTFLYLVLGNGKAIRYGIGVGREGFTWSGRTRISRMAEWPDWYPPEEMIERQPYLPRFMAGGPGNPLGARALYLGNTLYRIHGTNQPSTIGQFVSSGCIRLLNSDIEDLYRRVSVGTRVVVLPGKPPKTAEKTQ